MNWVLFKTKKPKNGQLVYTYNLDKDIFILGIMIISISVPSTTMILWLMRHTGLYHKHQRMLIMRDNYLF